MSKLHRTHWRAWTLLAVGGLLAVLAYSFSSAAVERELAANLDVRANEAQYSIQREVDRYAEVLRGLQGQFLTHPTLSPQEFRLLAEALKLDARLAGIQAIGYSPLLAAAAPAGHDSAASRARAMGTGTRAAADHSPESPLDEAMAVQYLPAGPAKLEADRLFPPSDAKHRVAIESARDSADWATTGRTILASTPGEPTGVIFFLPVYRGGHVPSTIAARRAQFAGVVFLSVRTDEMFRQVFGATLLHDLDIEIYDMQDVPAALPRHGRHNLIYDSSSFRQPVTLHAGNRAFPLQRARALNVGGSVWQVEVAALPDFANRSQSWLPRIAAAVSALVCLALFFFMRSLEHSQRSLQLIARSAEATAYVRGRALEACANPIAITNANIPDHPVEYVNSAFERVTGYPANEVVGRNLRFLQGADREQPGLKELRALVRERREGRVVIRNYRKDGSLFWAEVYVAPVRDANGHVTHYISAGYDITATKNYEAELEFQATRDTITKLANRNLLRDRLTQALAYAERYGHAVWVVCIDLDRFKFVIDTLGLAAGDELLTVVARRLEQAVREADTVARMVGDEFMLVLSERAQEKLSNSILQRLIDAVAQPMMLGEHEFFPTSSVGVAIYPGDGMDADALIQSAGSAVYRAKELGRNRYQFYTPEMNDRSRERLRIERDLRNALAQNEFTLHYQPQVDLRTGRMIGMEALIRWQHPALGLIAPSRFIGLAEETGMIEDIGAWVIRTACEQNMAWQRAGLGHLRVAINLSVRQFVQPELVRSIGAVLAQTGLDPRYVDIELTESLVMRDVEYAVRTLRELKALGVCLSIDDFGTGYSSLSYLKSLPIDAVKIDQSFVRDITSNPDDAAIARSVISMAHSLRLQVIAEGVETEAQLFYLRRQGCDQMQGYYFSPPIAAEAFGQLLHEGSNLANQLGGLAAKRQTLLIIDDEPHVISSLTRLLRQDGYDILKATTPSAAFELLARHAVQVIVCDQRMPDMSGSEFFSKVKEMHPDAVRIMLSGYTGLESVIESINRGAIHRFFTKPWDDQLLRDNIREAFRYYWTLYEVAQREGEEATITTPSSAREPIARELRH